MSNYCQSCGAVMDEGARFCKTCGTPVAISTANPVPEQPSSSQSSYQSNPAGSQQSPSGYTHYAQPAYAPAVGSEPLSVGQYVGMMLLSGLPLVGLILLLIWAFGSESNINKRNYARAVLIIALIAIALGVVFGVAMAGFMASIFRNYR